MTMTAMAGRGLDRYALVMSECDCGLCPPAPMWARRRGRSRRFTEPVTLMMAIEAEPSAAGRIQMVQEHRQCLGQLLAAADELLALTTVADPARAAAGLGLVMFSGELAAAVRSREFMLEPLPEELRQVCLETVMAAMSTAAGSLVMMTEMMELAAGMASVLSSGL